MPAPAVVEIVVVQHAPDQRQQLAVAGKNGAGEQPQLPATIVVMPCSSSGASTRP